MSPWLSGARTSRYRSTMNHCGQSPVRRSWRVHDAQDVGDRRVAAHGRQVLHRSLADVAQAPRAAAVLLEPVRRGQVDAGVVGEPRDDLVEPVDRRHRRPRRRVRRSASPARRRRLRRSGSAASVGSAARRSAREPASAASRMLPVTASRNLVTGRVCTLIHAEPPLDAVLVERGVAGDPRDVVAVGRDDVEHRVRVPLADRRVRVRPDVARPRASSISIVGRRPVLVLAGDDGSVTSSSMGPPRSTLMSRTQAGSSRPRLEADVQDALAVVVEPAGAVRGHRERGRHAEQSPTRRRRGRRSGGRCCARCRGDRGAP